MKSYNKIATFTITILVLMLLTGCTAVPQLTEPTTQTIDLTQDTTTGQNMTGELPNIAYCTSMIDECITLNRREKTGTNGFLGASTSGFLFSGDNNKQPKLSDAPKTNNVSSVVIETEGNMAEQIVYNGVYTINGTIMKGVESVEVIWNGDNESFFLKKFVPNQGKFSYFINPTFGNVKPGLNKYLIRGYQSPNIVFERVFTLRYITGGNDIVLQSAKELTRDNQYGLYTYNTENDESYALGFSQYTFANQMFTTPTGGKIVYMINKEKQHTVKIQNKKGEYSNSKEYRLSCDEIGCPKIKEYDGGYITLYKAYHEASNDTLIYNEKNNTIISINDDLLRPTSKDKFYGIYSYTIVGDNITITEQPYCCDTVDNPGGYEEFVFNLQTKKLISKKSIPMPQR